VSHTVRRLWALLYGAACHGGFLVAVGLMAVGLFTGMESGLGRLDGRAGLVLNVLLLLQFPLLHSFLLTRRGRGVLGRLAPRELGRSLAPTTYALLAALQIGTTFALWSPTGVTLWRPTGAALVVHSILFAGAWLFLGKALLDAGLGLQTGWIGWSSVWKNGPVRYPGLPTTGLFATCRQPIYLGFALILWTGPTWTLDHLLIALAWSAYCVLGPRLKERRFAQIYGQAFEAYRRKVPYLLPKLFP